MIQGYSLCSVLRLEMMSILWIIENETLQKKSVVKVIFKIFYLFDKNVKIWRCFYLFDQFSYFQNC
jgi:hypothetical protein